MPCASLLPFAKGAGEAPGLPVSSSAGGAAPSPPPFPVETSDGLPAFRPVARLRRTCRTAWREGDRAGRGLASEAACGQERGDRGDGQRMTNTLYYGDNLHVLREHIADASVAIGTIPFAARTRKRGRGGNDKKTLQCYTKDY
jgi:hypothetical protein